MNKEQKKILVVFGTRPEAIKMAPLVKEIEKSESLQAVVCVTSQHREMLDQVLDFFEIKPDYDLNIMSPGQTLSTITTKVIEGINSVIEEVKPNVVLVHGDTTTAFAATLSSFYNQVSIGHVEAGLRTRNKYSPYPEEINRKLIDSIADLFFAPTNLSRNNLLEEAVPPENIFVTGNTVIDAMKWTVSSDYNNDVFEWLGENKLILLTAHRRENLGAPMERIFEAIREVLEENEGYKLVYPVHLNPVVQNMANKVFGDSDKVKLIPPLDVFDFHNFLDRAYIVLTDSGGVQEEAPSLGKPVLVLRDTTERPEGVDAGTLLLVGTTKSKIKFELLRLMQDSKMYKQMSETSNPYGDGEASKRIVEVLEKYE